MNRGRRVAVALAAALAALSCSASGLGQQTTECFGQPATRVGTAANDVLLGTEGNDVIVGLGGVDVIVGLGGDDALCGGPGGDGFQPGAGNDRVDGGEIEPLAANFVDYTPSTQPVRVDLGAGTATGEGSDRLVNITAVDGSRYDDVLVGDENSNNFDPAGGNDTVRGGAGDDAVGFDRAVNANLATGRAMGEGNDTLESIEAIHGSDFADVLVGSAASNYISGNEGNDRIDGGPGDDRAFGDEGNDRVAGGAGSDGVNGGLGTDRVLGNGGDDTVVGSGGNDTIDGGAGRDDVTYISAAAPRGVQVNLLVGAALGDGTDTLAGVENVEATERRDRVLGNERTNFLLGAAGSDRISADAGDDFLDGGTGASSVVDGGGRDYCLRGGGASKCEVAGVPGSVPAIPDRTPQVQRSFWQPISNERPIVMPLPAGVTLSHSMLERTRRAWVGTYGDLSSGEDAWKLESPLLELFESAAPPGTGVFRYTDPPSCFSAQRPFRTTVSPPSEVKPAVTDGALEIVYWKGVLFRKRGSKLERVAGTETPWLSGIVQGPDAPTGFPVWRRERTEFSSPKVFPFSVPAGEYAWVGTLRWIRSPGRAPAGGRVEGFIEPHVARAQKAQVDKSCVFR